jgi:hypothetical protein
MPYYVFKITPGPSEMIKNLELQQEFDAYRDAKAFARSMRAQLESDKDIIVKVIFAANQLEAEERLQEHREAPILREWEK